MRRLARALHPLQIGPGTEMPALARQHDHPHRRIVDELREGGVELADHGLIERIEHLGPRHGDLGHASSAHRDGQSAHQ